MAKYQKYKEINLPWLKIIPANWDIKRNKQFLHERKKIVGNKSSEYTLLSLTLRGIVVRDLSENKGKIPANFDNYKIVEPGDIAFCLFDIDETPRTVGLSKYKGMLTGAYNIFHIEGINARYLYYYYLALDNIKGLRPLYTGLRKTINVNTFLSQQMPVPPRAEQDQIVRFLDWKVSEINKLIGIRKKEIPLIRQYRELRITERLKGKKVWIKRLLKSPLQYGANSSGTDFISDLPRYIRITDIDSDGNLKQDGAKSIIEEDAAPYILEDGDILLARSGATVGKAFLYKKCYGLSAYAGYLIRAKFDNSRILPEYFMYFTNSSTYSDWKNYVFIQATIQNISAEKYGYLPIPLPSIDEQKRIVNELDLICKYMDSLVEIKYKEIHTLQELKAVIISDVVTGKIDVRNVTIPEYEHVDDIYDDNNEDSKETDETETDGEEA